jgi:hypothetical protein
MIGRISGREKLKCLEKSLPQSHVFHHNSPCSVLGMYPDLQVEKPMNKYQFVLLIFCRVCRLSPDFQAHGFTAEDFDVMCGIASWATCGPARSTEMSVSEEYDNGHTHADGQRLDSYSKNDTQCS